MHVESTKRFRGAGADDFSENTEIYVLGTSVRLISTFARTWLRVFLCCLFFVLPPGDEDVDDLEDGDEDGDGLVGSADGGIAGDVHGEVVVDDAATVLAGAFNGE